MPTQRLRGPTRTGRQSALAFAGKMHSKKNAAQLSFRECFHELPCPMRGAHFSFLMSKSLFVLTLSKKKRRSLLLNRLALLGTGHRSLYSNQRTWQNLVMGHGCSGLSLDEGNSDFACGSKKRHPTHSSLLNFVVYPAARSNPFGCHHLSQKHGDHIMWDFQLSAKSTVSGSGGRKRTKCPWKVQEIILEVCRLTSRSNFPLKQTQLISTPDPNLNFVPYVTLQLLRKNVVESKVCHVLRDIFAVTTFHL